MTLAAGIKEALVDIVGRDHVRVASRASTSYDRDTRPLLPMIPDAVVFPGSTEEVAVILRGASACGVPIIPRGTGTNLCAAPVPVPGGIVLALSRLNKILDISGEELLARVQPGVTTAHVADAATARGLRYTPGPGSRTVSTIGGTIATCAGELRGLLGMEAVLATGEVIRIGGRSATDAAGDDLTRLLTGSAGTLAVITEATLALHPAPAGSTPGMGRVTGADGVGATKHHPGAEQVRLLRRFKSAFDPAGILNPGKLG